MNKTPLLIACLIVLCASSTVLATTYGPDSVLQCPHSKSVVRQRNLASGNSARRVAWSDGYVNQPFFPEQPAITRCNHGPIFWVSDAKVLGEIPLGKDARSPASWKKAPHVRLLTPREYLEAISLGLAKTPRQEKYLRMHAWWGVNESVRQSKETGPANPFTNPSPDRENLESLLPLFDEKDPGELCLKAEAFRELGRFDEASELLKRKLPKEYRKAQKKMMEWTKNKEATAKKFFDASEDGN